MAVVPRSSDVFALKVIFTIIIFLKLFLIGFLKGNGIEVNNVQFPEVFAAIRKWLKNWALKTISVPHKRPFVIGQPLIKVFLV